MRRSLGMGLLLVLAWLGSGQAQEMPQCVPTTMVVNRQGDGTAITVAGVAVQVLDVNALACQRTIRNIGSAPMHCMPVIQGVPTTTRGQLFNPGEQLTMLTEGRQSWQCIRTTGTSTTVNTLESIP